MAYCLEALDQGVWDVTEPQTYQHTQTALIQSGVLFHLRSKHIKAKKVLKKSKQQYLFLTRHTSAFFVLSN